MADSESALVMVEEISEALQIPRIGLDRINDAFGDPRIEVVG